MGLPARKIDERHESRAARPRLELVPKARASRSRASAAFAARDLFRTFAVVLAVVALLGIARIWLSVRAAEASIASSDLRREIKLTRYEGDMLEVRLSALSSPSRVRALACATMDMAPAGEPTYVDIRHAEKGASPTVAARPKSGFEKALVTAMGLAAGEAQVLLVGDVGLASTR